MRLVVNQQNVDGVKPVVDYHRHDVERSAPSTRGPPSKCSDRLGAILMVPLLRTSRCARLTGTSASARSQATNKVLRCSRRQTECAAFLSTVELLVTSRSGSDRPPDRSAHGLGDRRPRICRD